MSYRGRRILEAVTVASFVLWLQIMLWIDHSAALTNGEMWVLAAIWVSWALLRAICWGSKQ